MELRRTEHLAHVFSLDQLSRRCDPAYGLHRECGGPALIHERTQEAAFVSCMRVPMSVKTAQPRGGQGLVHGCEELKCGIAPGDIGRMGGQELRKIRIEQVRIARTTAVMDQSGDDADAQFIKPGQTGVVPSPITDIRMLGCDRLPDDRITYGPNSECGQAVQVFEAIMMAGFDHLVPETISDASDRTFYSAPHLEIWHLVRCHVTRRGTAAAVAFSAAAEMPRVTPEFFRAFLSAARSSGNLCRSGS